MPAVVLAKEIVETEQVSLSLMNIAVRRNAFGRQIESFETVLQIEGLPPSRAVFIRAPYVERVWGEARILSYYRDKAVMVRENNLLATAFHPELTEDLNIHRYFLAMFN